MLNTNEYDKLIKCDFNVIITKTKFQHLIVQDIYREVGWELSEVEKIVIIHGNRDESKKAKILSEIYLYQGLLLSIKLDQVILREMASEAMLVAIDELISLGVEGVEAIHTNKHQSRAFSPNIIIDVGESTDQAH
jgi:hypothetical protein